MNEPTSGGVELTDELRPRPTPRTVHEDQLRRGREARRKIIEKWARKRKSGRAIFCTPSEAELTAGKSIPGWGTNGKVIYDSVEIAEWAARELELLGCWAMRAYVCERSQHGHAHLAGKVARTYDY